MTTRREREREREQLQTAISNLKQEKTDLETQINQKNQAIADLQKPNNQTIEEVKEKIRKKAKEMKINATQLEKMLENAQSYQQLVDLEQKIFTERLTEKENSLFQSERAKSNLKISLVVTLIGTGVIILGAILLIYK